MTQRTNATVEFVVNVERARLEAHERAGARTDLNSADQLEADLAGILGPAFGNLAKPEATASLDPDLAIAIRTAAVEGGKRVDKWILAGFEKPRPGLWSKLEQTWMSIVTALGVNVSGEHNASPETPTNE